MEIRQNCDDGKFYSEAFVDRSLKITILLYTELNCNLLYMKPNQDVATEDSLIFNLEF